MPADQGRPPRLYLIVRHGAYEFDVRGVTICGTNGVVLGAYSTPEACAEAFQQYSAHAEAQGGFLNGAVYQQEVVIDAPPDWSAAGSPFATGMQLAPLNAKREGAAV